MSNLVNSQILEDLYEAVDEEHSDWSEEQKQKEAYRRFDELAANVPD